MQNNQIEIRNEKLYVGLGSNIDFFRWESFSTNERIDESKKPDGLIYFEVHSLNEASELTRKFISTYRLGASNWVGGIVLDGEMKFKAKISYNGRIWDNKDWKIAKEIVC